MYNFFNFLRKNGEQKKKITPYFSAYEQEFNHKKILVRGEIMETYLVFCLRHEWLLIIVGKNKKKPKKERFFKKNLWHELVFVTVSRK